MHFHTLLFWEAEIHMHSQSCMLTHGTEVSLQVYYTAPW